MGLITRSFPAVKWESVSCLYKDALFVVPRLRSAGAIDSKISYELMQKCLDVLRRDGGLEWSQCPLVPLGTEQTQDVALPELERLFGSLSNGEVASEVVAATGDLGESAFDQTRMNAGPFGENEHRLELSGFQVADDFDVLPKDVIISVLVQNLKIQVLFPGYR